jgi:hypothetical protein
MLFFSSILLLNYYWQYPFCVTSFSEKIKNQKLFYWLVQLSAFGVTITLLFSTVQGKREVHLRQIELYFRNLGAIQ